MSSPLSVAPALLADPCHQLRTGLPSRVCSRRLVVALLPTTLLPDLVTLSTTGLNHTGCMYLLRISGPPSPTIGSENARSLKFASMKLPCASLPCTGPTVRILGGLTPGAETKLHAPLVV